MNPISVETTLRITPPTTAAMIASTPKSGGKPPTLKLRSILSATNARSSSSPPLITSPNSPKVISVSGNARTLISGLMMAFTTPKIRPTIRTVVTCGSFPNEISG